MTAPRPIRPASHSRPATRRARFVALLVALAALAPAAGFAQVSAESEVYLADLTRRVRPSGPRAVYTVGRALELCPTIRSLVAQIEASDLIVYVKIEHRDSGPAGWIRFVGGTPVARVLGVHLRDDLSTPQMVMLLGHELQHAVEVSEAPQVRDRESFEAHYRCPGFGTVSPNRFDTPGAIRVGRQVRRELAQKGIVR